MSQIRSQVPRPLKQDSSNKKKKLPEIKNATESSISDYGRLLMSHIPHTSSNIEPRNSNKFQREKSLQRALTSKKDEIDNFILRQD